MKTLKFHSFRNQHTPQTHLRVGQSLPKDRPACFAVQVGWHVCARGQTGHARHTENAKSRGARAKRPVSARLGCRAVLLVGLARWLQLVWATKRQGCEMPIHTQTDCRARPSHRHWKQSQATAGTPMQGFQNRRLTEMGWRKLGWSITVHHTPHA